MAGNGPARSGCHPPGWLALEASELASTADYSFVGGPFGSDLTTKHYVPDGVPVIRGANLSGRDRWMVEDGFVYVTAEKADELRRNLAYPGDLVFTQRGTLGQVARIRPASGLPRFVLSQSQMKLAVHGEKADADFLYYFFASPIALREIERATIATGLPHINLGILKRFLVPVPPLPEQRKIAAILSSVDDAIVATQSVIDQLGVVKKAMMAELLTRGLPGRHARLKQTEIGEVPEAWGVVRLSDILTAGPSNGRSPQARATPPGVPTFSIAAVRDGRVNVRGNLKYVDLEPNEVARFAVRPGDILIVRGNANPGLVGKCGIVEDAPPDCIFPDLLMRISLKGEMLPSMFVTVWNADVVHQQILDKAKTTNGTYKINGEDVRSTLIPKPPLDEQRVLSGVFEALDASAQANAATLSGLEAVKSALMSVLLTGEVRVTPDEDPA